MNLTAFPIAAYKRLAKKTLLITQLTTLILLVAILECSAKGFSQKVSLNVENTSLKDVLKIINKQTGYVFFYDTKDLRDKKVSLKVSEAPLEEVLSLCLKDLQLTYKILNGTVLLQQKDVEAREMILNKAAPDLRIEGQVFDDKNSPLAGVTVKLKGGNAVTVTNNDGKFKLSVSETNAVLVFSFVGFVTKEVSVTPDKQVEVRMEPESAKLNEIVVVGYGTQKKVNLTGSVSTVSGEEITRRPAPNASNLLQGKVTGLDIVQSTGQPGRDGANFQIRGFGSFGASSAPLILIDGVIGDLNLINPNDIESVSVLKDAASAAIYGNRAANGVILVTTKRGKSGVAAITYSNNFSLNQPTRLPSLVYNSAEYMEMFNQARDHSGQTPIYTQAQIDAYKNAPAGSKEYPNYNWIDNYINNSFSQNHHLGISGGANNTTYNLSVGYLGQNGIIKSTDYDRYNMLFNIDSRLNNTFKVGSTISFTKQKIVEPWLTNDDLVLLIYQAAPTFAPFLPDGSGRLASNDYVGAAGHNRSPEFTLSNGNITTNNYQARAQVYLETKLAKGLTWQVKGAFNYNDQLAVNYQYAGAEYYYQPDVSGNYVLADNGGPAQIGVSNADSRNIYLNAYSTLNYEKTFATDHHLNVLGGYSVETFRNEVLSAYRPVFPVSSLTQLDAGSITGQNLGGNAYEYALQSFFGRVNYNYKEKYLLEINGRYDGSSRIAPDKRYGLFPSFSAGWRMSQEDFIRSAAPWISNLKIRASYGKLGNQEIGIYPYQDILNLVSYSFNNQGVSQGVQQQRLTDKNLRWETTNVTDLGLDLDIKNGLFTATFDWYNKKTTGILTQPSILYAVGLDAPITNFGTLQNRGFELNLGHTKRIGKDFRYSVNALLSVNRNKLLKIAARQDKGMYLDEVGLPYDSYYLTEWTGIFQSQDEIAKSPSQPYNPKPGDLKFRDATGNGKVDADDRVVVKGMYPAYTYSFNLGFGYKSFELNAFMQGVQGIKRYVNGWGIDPFFQGSPPMTLFRNAWTPENPSQTTPALYTAGYAPVDGTNSTYFLKDASYLRIKSVQLTYRLPGSITQRLKMKSVMVYVSGDNLFTFTKYPGDPERLQTTQTAIGVSRGPNTRYAQYPQVRMFTTGLNIQF